MNWKQLLSVLISLLVLAGCDSNPNGPSAPSGSGSGKEQPGDTKGKVPLKSVGEPIG